MCVYCCCWTLTRMLLAIEHRPLQVSDVSDTPRLSVVRRVHRAAPRHCHRLARNLRQLGWLNISVSTRSWESVIDAKKLCQQQPTTNQFQDFCVSTTTSPVPYHTGVCGSPLILILCHIGVWGKLQCDALLVSESSGQHHVLLVQQTYFVCFVFAGTFQRSWSLSEAWRNPRNVRSK